MFVVSACLSCVVVLFVFAIVAVLLLPDCLQNQLVLFVIVWFCCFDVVLRCVLCCCSFCHVCVCVVRLFWPFSSFYPVFLFYQFLLFLSRLLCRCTFVVSVLVFVVSVVSVVFVDLCLFVLPVGFCCFRCFC